MNKNILIGLGVVVLLFLGVTFPRSGGTVVERIVGANAGPESSSNYYCNDGLCHQLTKKALTTATSTPCAIQAPTSASSTLVATHVQIITATSTAVTWELASATSAFATTTLLMTDPTASGAQDYINYAPTTTATQVLGPGAWIVWGAKGFAPAGSSYLLGRCSAEFVF